LAVAVITIVLAFKLIPSSFIPQEDQGELMIIVKLPEGSPSDQTVAVVNQVENNLLTQENKAIASIFASVGFSFGGSA